MTVTKQEIVSLLADSTGLTKMDVEVIVNGFMYNIIESLQNGERVEIRGFPYFDRQNCLSRASMNIY